MLACLGCSAMLSRFDLIFPLLDKPDSTLDQKLSEHIMALHSGGWGGTLVGAARQSWGGVRQDALHCHHSPHLTTRGSGFLIAWTACTEQTL